MTQIGLELFENFEDLTWVFLGCDLQLDFSDLDETLIA